MEKTKLINQAQADIKELLGLLNHFENQSTELLDILDVLAQVYRKLPEAKNLKQCLTA